MKKTLIIIAIALIAITATIAIFLVINRSPANIADNGLCRQIEGPDKYYCLARVEKNPELCKKIDGADSQVCSAILLEDSSYCQKISSPEAKKMCYNELARASGKIDYCDQAEDKESCYFSFISGKYWDGKSSEIDKSVCSEKFASQSPEVKTCLALIDGSAALCEDNSTCKIFFNRDLNFCQDISDKKDVDIQQTECIKNVALLTKDASICDKMPSSKKPEINDCFLDFVGHILPDSSICDKITDKQIKTGCLIEAALGQSLK